MRWTQYIASFLFLVLCFVVMGCKTTSRTLSQEEITIREGDDGPRPGGKVRPSSGCRNPENYIPDTLLLDHTPLRIIALRIHFMYDSLGHHNIPKHRTSGICLSIGRCDEQPPRQQYQVKTPHRQ